MITFVGAGLLAPKKAWSRAIGRQHYYLNFGCLALASSLAERGLPVRLLHGGFSEPEKFAFSAARENWDGEYPLFLSIPSFHALTWSQRFCRAFRECVPRARIVAGGRWVVDGAGAWIRQRIPEVDLVVYGNSERRIHSLIVPSRWKDVAHTDLTGGPPESPLGALPRLDFRLAAHFEQFQPSIEVSRGCGMGCQFCAENALALTRLRRASEVAEAMAEASAVYGSLDLTPYLEASFFLPTAKWATEFGQARRELGVTLQWRCETRADSVTPEVLESLVAAGLKVLDLGLESASSAQLTRMGKTRDPRRYLARASRLLEKCRELGVWAKVNYLVYAGETAETFSVTADWLASHASCIKGVSAGPVVIYGPNAEGRHFEETLRALGATPVDEQGLLRDGYSEIHPSAELDHEAAVALCVQLSQEHMTTRDYFDLKAFSYFPRGYSFEEFQRLVAECGTPETLPFRSESSGSRAWARWRVGSSANGC